jgi:predicted DNA-binding antitoxin AbrB/MazE fold protein
MDGKVVLKPERNAMSMVRAIYEAGVFRPLTPPELPEGAEVEFGPQLVRAKKPEVTMEDIYAVLDMRFSSGEHEVTERHNEHQP